MKKGLLVLVGCAMVASVPAAAADNAFAQEEAVVRLSGLDLSTVEGQQRLAIRMDDAARAVCGDRLASVHLTLGARTRECQAEVVSNIRAQIDGRAMVAAKGSQRIAASR